MLLLYSVGRIRHISAFLPVRENAKYSVYSQYQFVQMKLKENLIKGRMESEVYWWHKSYPFSYDFFFLIFFLLEVRIFSF